MIGKKLKVFPPNAGSSVGTIWGTVPPEGAYLTITPELVKLHKAKLLRISNEEEKQETTTEPVPDSVQESDRPAPAQGPSEAGPETQAEAEETQEDPPETPQSSQVGPLADIANATEDDLRALDDFGLRRYVKFIDGVGLRGRYSHEQLLQQALDRLAKRRALATANSATNDS